MKLTGQKLKEKREAARLTISEVSLATKINPKVLMAMEAGDSEHLPAKTFLRGFVRSYAGFLKMNAEEVLETFNQELGEAAQKEAVEAPGAEPKKEAAPAKVDVNGEGSGTFRMFIIGGILVLIVLIIGVRSVVQKYERERHTDTASDLSASKVVPLEDKKTDEKKESDKALTPPSGDDAPASAAASSEPSSGTQSVPEATSKADAKKASEAKRVADDNAAKVAEERKLAEEKAAKAADEKKAAEAAAAKKAADDKAAEAKKAADAKAAEEKKAADAKAAADVKAAADAKKPAAKGKHHEIILEALDKVEVSFNFKGQTKKIPMTTGQVHTIITDAPISFDISDGGALNITDNGRDKGPAGDLGHRKQISIP